MKSITKRFASKLAMTAVVSMSLIGTGCVDEEPSTENLEEVSASATTLANPTASFLASCHEDGYTTNSQPVRAITHAWARSGCFTVRGTVGAPQDWRGLCFTDMKNVDGRLVCGD